MATRKKQTKKKQTGLKTTASKRKPAKAKKTAKKPVKNKKSAHKKKLAKKKPAVKKAAVKTNATARKTTAAKTKTAGASKKRARGQDQSANIESFASEEVRTRSAGQSGSLQGLSDSAGADSESVDELIEEGNAFEADVVSGVEAADRADEQEVRTHEVPEDDVPGEYLGED